MNTLELQLPNNGGTRRFEADYDPETDYLILGLEGDEWALPREVWATIVQFVHAEIIISGAKCIRKKESSTVAPYRAVEAYRAAAPYRTKYGVPVYLTYVSQHNGTITFEPDYSSRFSNVMQSKPWRNSTFLKHGTPSVGMYYKNACRVSTIQELIDYQLLKSIFFKDQQDPGDEHQPKSDALPNHLAYQEPGDEYQRYDTTFKPLQDYTGCP